MCPDATPSGSHRRVKRHARVALCAIAVACTAGIAHAEPRFGDSTWVAPNYPGDTLTFVAGPRVAPPDHERTWETVLRAPFRVAFFPLRLAVDGVERLSDVVAPKFLEMQPGQRTVPTGPRFGVQVGVGGLTDLGVGPTVSWRNPAGEHSSLFLATQMSTKDRRTAELRINLGERRPVGFAFRALYDRKPNVRFYGIGNDAPRADSSYYLLENVNVNGQLLVGSVPHRQLRFLAGYSSLSPQRGYFGSPLLEDVFPPGAVPFEHRGSRELYYGAGADLAALDDSRNPSFGVHARVDLERDNGVRAQDPDYDRWRLEGRGYLPVFAQRRVLAARVVYTGVDPRDGTTEMPYYRLVTNENTTALAGYSSNRWTDRQFALARLEYRWVIIYTVSAVALYERAEVAPVRSAFTWPAAHSAWGGGLRFAPTEHKTLRFEVGKSKDGFHTAFRLGSDW